MSFISASLSAEAFWSFDSHLRDLNNNFNANASGNPSFVSSYLGSGAALRSFELHLNMLLSSTHNCSSTLPVSPSKHGPIRSVWPQLTLASSDNVMLPQQTCACFSSFENYKLCCGFWNNDLLGTTNVAMNTWSHVACVYDLSAQTQTVFLNGVADGSRSSPPYTGSKSVIPRLVLDIWLHLAATFSMDILTRCDFHYERRMQLKC